MVNSKNNKNSCGNNFKSQKGNRPHSADKASMQASRKKSTGMSAQQRKQQEKLKKKKEHEEKKAIKKQLRRLNKRRAAKTNLSRSVQSSIPYITEYDHGVLELDKAPGKNASLYSIMMEFEDINYQTLSVEQGETVFSRYRDLLNTFNPSNFYQISIVKGAIDQKSLEKKILGAHSRKREGKLEELQRERDNIIMQSLSRNDTADNRKSNLYLTVSTTAKDQLEAFRSFNRIEVNLTNAFKKLGSKAHRLDTMERLEVYHDIYRPEWIGQFNPDHKMNYQSAALKNISLKDYICPDGICFDPSDHIQMGKGYYQCLLLNDFPNSISDELIGAFAELDMDMVITISINPYHTDDAALLIKRQLNSMNRDKAEQQKKNINNKVDMDAINPDLKDAIENAELLREAIKKNNQMLFDFSVMIMHRADTMEELKQNLESINTVAAKYLCHIAVLKNLQEPAMYQIMPYGNTTMPSLYIPIPSETLAAYIPFSSMELLDEDGIWYGNNAITKKILMVNRLKLMNSNGFILGTSGSGKSMTGKNEKLDSLCYADDEEVIIIDPEEEYTIFHESGYFNSVIVQLSAGSELYKNPMDMDKDYGIADEGDALKSKSEFLISVFAEAISGGRQLSGGQLGILDKCIRKVYEPYISSGYNPDYIPTFTDVQDILEAYGKTDREAYEMAKAFEPFSRGLLNYFSHKSNVDLDNKQLIIYDISKLGEQLKNIGYLVMLDAIWNRVLQNKKKGIRTRVDADEFTVIMGSPYAKRVFLDMFKRFRKMGGVATGLTQNISSLLRDGEAIDMLQNAEFLILLKQKEVDRIKLGEIFGLSEEQLKYVTDADPGCGLIRVSGKVIPFEMRYPKDTISYRMMTTKMEDKIRGKNNKHGTQTN